MTSTLAHSLWPAFDCQFHWCIYIFLRLVFCQCRFAVIQEKPPFHGDSFTSSNFNFNLFFMPYLYMPFLHYDHFHLLIPLIPITVHSLSFGCSPLAIASGIIYICIIEYGLNGAALESIQYTASTYLFTVGFCPKSVIHYNSQFLFGGALFGFMASFIRFPSFASILSLGFPFGQIYFYFPASLSVVYFSSGPIDSLSFFPRCLPSNFLLCPQSLFPLC